MDDTSTRQALEDAAVRAMKDGEHHIKPGTRWHDTDADQIKVWNGTAWEPDYRALLKRYMNRVCEAEGVYFISEDWTEAPGKFVRSYPGTSDADDYELCRLAEEISAYCVGERDD